MNDIRYKSAFTIKNSNRSMSKRSNDNPKRKVFNGTISNSNLDSYNTRIGEKALRSFARSARNGVPVLAQHDRFTQIGRSIKGTYNSDQKNVESELYVPLILLPI